MVHRKLREKGIDITAGDFGQVPSYGNHLMFVANGEHHIVSLPHITTMASEVLWRYCRRYGFTTPRTFDTAVRKICTKHCFHHATRKSFEDMHCFYYEVVTGYPNRLSNRLDRKITLVDPKNDPQGYVAHSKFHTERRSCVWVADPLGNRRWIDEVKDRSIGLSRAREVGNKARMVSVKEADKSRKEINKLIKQIEGVINHVEHN